MEMSVVDKINPQHSSDDDVDVHLKQNVITTQQDNKISLIFKNPIEILDHSVSDLDIKTDNDSKALHVEQLDRPKEDIHHLTPSVDKTIHNIKSASIDQIQIYNKDNSNIDNNNNDNNNSKSMGIFTHRLFKLDQMNSLQFMQSTTADLSTTENLKYLNVSRDGNDGDDDDDASLQSLDDDADPVDSSSDDGMKEDEHSSYEEENLSSSYEEDDEEEEEQEEDYETDDDESFVVMRQTRNRSAGKRNNRGVAVELRKSTRLKKTRSNNLIDDNDSDGDHGDTHRSDRTDNGTADKKVAAQQLTTTTIYEVAGLEQVSASRRVRPSKKQSIGITTPPITVDEKTHDTHHHHHHHSSSSLESSSMKASSAVGAIHPAEVNITIGKRSHKPTNRYVQQSYSPLKKRDQQRSSAISRKQQNNINNNKSTLTKWSIYKQHVNTLVRSISKEQHFLHLYEQDDNVIMINHDLKVGKKGNVNFKQQKNREPMPLQEILKSERKIFEAKKSILSVFEEIESTVQSYTQ